MSKILTLIATTTVGEVDSVLEDLRYGLEMSKERAEVNDLESVNRVLKLMASIQKTLEPFNKDALFSSAYPEDGQNYVDSVIELGNLFLECPETSVDQVKMEMSKEHDLIALLPHLKVASSRTKED